LINSQEPFLVALRDAIYTESEHLKQLLDTFKEYFTAYSKDLLDGDVGRYLEVWTELRLLRLLDYDPFPVPKAQLNPQMNPSYLKLQTNAISEVSLKRKIAYSTLYSTH
jgi:hypothetical protein